MGCILFEQLDKQFKYFKKKRKKNPEYCTIRLWNPELETLSVDFQENALWYSIHFFTHYSYQYSEDIDTRFLNSDKIILIYDQLLKIGNFRARSEPKILK